MEIPDAVMYAYEFSLGVDMETNGSKKNVTVSTSRPRTARKDSNADVHGSTRSGTSTVMIVVLQSQKRTDEEEDIDFDEDVEQDDDGYIVINPILSPLWRHIMPPSSRLYLSCRLIRPSRYHNYRNSF